MPQEFTAAIVRLVRLDAYPPATTMTSLTLVGALMASSWMLMA